MKQHTFNKNSWHYNLASLGSTTIDSGFSVDLCTYLRAMLKAVIAIVFLVVVVFWAGVIAFNVVGDFLAWIAYMAINLSLIFPDGPALACVLIGAVSLLVFICKSATERLREYFEKHRRDYIYKKSEPSFLKVAYLKFKSKTCFYIDFE